MSERTPAVVFRESETKVPVERENIHIHRNIHSFKISTERLPGQSNPLPPLVPPSSTDSSSSSTTSTSTSSSYSPTSSVVYDDSGDGDILVDEHVATSRVSSAENEILTGNGQPFR